MKCGDCGSDMRNKPICACGWRFKSTGAKPTNRAPNRELTDTEEELFKLAVEYKVGGETRYDRAKTMQLHMRVANDKGMKVGDYIDSLPNSLEEFLAYKKRANWTVV